MKYTRQKGTKDIFSDDIKIWNYVEENVRKICKTYNINEIRTPIFESTELFARGVGDGTDVVNKEMYTFTDKGGRSITLRPELTAGVVRAYIENGMSSLPSPQKLWYIGNMYRYEKMQKGRYREFSQFGIEYFGSNSYLADVEVIQVALTLFEKLDLLDDIRLDINSIGCSDCRAKYILKLKEYVKPYLNDMCDTCKVRYEKNPMRIIDCKEEKCKQVLKVTPMITDNLCDECKNDFENLQNLLSQLNIKYNIDKGIVRGLDYYNKTVFEFTNEKLGLAIGGGGRYDKLVETLGGASTPAVGFGMGMDRLVLLLQEKNNQINNKKVVYILAADEIAYPKAKELMKYLQENGCSVEIDISKRSFNAQLKYANKLKAQFVIIIGEAELKKGICIVKNMKHSVQIELKLDKEQIFYCIK